ncbi:uncharacterized protein LOC126588163 [Malus sylvestris]|uniref:uncharacterized protein LOC126588163 n=1 Tax=Malus sylvestris TaxID=3752 RepID=UPI0021ACD3DE|nr:uncharacterized protein LOC126588163 [Malus sylvestris]
MLESRSEVLVIEFHGGMLSVLKNALGGRLGVRRRCSPLINPKSFTKLGKLLGGVRRTLGRLEGSWTVWVAWENTIGLPRSRRTLANLGALRLVVFSPRVSLSPSRYDDG